MIGDEKYWYNILYENHFHPLSLQKASKIQKISQETSLVGMCVAPFLNQKPSSLKITKLIVHKSP